MRLVLALIILTTPAFAQSTKIGVVVGAESSIIRRVIVPDNEAELKPELAGAGERLLIMDRGVDITAEVKRVTGVAPIVPTVEIIGKDGSVEGTIAADPSIDSLPGKTLKWPKETPVLMPPITVDSLEKAIK